jgi:hypothetical protein
MDPSIFESEPRPEPEPETEPDDDVKTVDLFPWNWRINMPWLTVNASLPGWFLILVFVCFARGPERCVA